MPRLYLKNTQQQQQQTHTKQLQEMWMRVAMCVFLDIDKTRNMIGKTLICVEARWGIGRFSYTGSSSSFVYM